MQHTQGTWTFLTAANGDCGISAEGTGIFIECFAEIRRSGEGAREEAKANAQLVIAGPRMLAALKHLEAVISPERTILKGHVDFKDGALEVIRTAIDHAEGRS